MKDFKIICINGPKGSGKTTLAVNLAALMPVNAGVYHLADPIKEAVSGPYWPDVEHMKDIPIAGDQLTLREKYIAWGEKKRKEAPDFFIRKFVEHVAINPDVQIWIIGDVRKQEEFDALIRLYGVGNILLVCTAQEDISPGYDAWKGDLGGYVELPADFYDREHTPRQFSRLIRACAAETRAWNILNGFTMRGLLPKAEPTQRPPWGFADDA